MKSLCRYKYIVYFCDVYIINIVSGGNIIAFVAWVCHEYNKIVEKNSLSREIAL